MRVEEIDLSLSGSSVWQSDAANLAREVKKAKKYLQTKSKKDLEIFVLSSYFTGFLLDYLAYYFLIRGIVANFTAGQYGEIATAILDPNHVIHGSSFDLLLILPTVRDISVDTPQNSGSASFDRESIETEVAGWANLWSSLRVPVVQALFEPPMLRKYSNVDGLVQSGGNSYVRELNRAIEQASPSSVTLLDTYQVASNIGVYNWHDPYLYSLCKQPMSMRALPHFADEIASTVMALRGLSRKVLVLDLDNTLWHGIIGDDGIEGIEVGPESDLGECYYEFQSYIKMLSRRGVILAICSKNEESNARLPFKHHDGMVLKEQDIACFVANFDDKATNIRKIASSLNVGLDSIVFVDDSAIERALVRGELPMVLTLEMPENPAEYARHLDAVNPFALTQVTQEDLSRSLSYKSRHQFEQQMSKATDIDQFLLSLDATITFESIQPSNIDRAHQLVGKTNQFKLNSRVPNKSDLLLNQDKDYFVVKLSDKMQNYGIIAVIFAEVSDSQYRITNWVMSCRVFSRRIEYATLEFLRDKAKLHNCNYLRFDFEDTGKNTAIQIVLEDLKKERFGRTSQFDNEMIFPIEQLNSISEPICAEVIIGG